MLMLFIFKSWLCTFDQKYFCIRIVLPNGQQLHFGKIGCHYNYLISFNNLKFFLKRTKTEFTSKLCNCHLMLIVNFVNLLNAQF